MKTLIVENHSHIRQSLAQSVTDLGCEAAECDSSEQAIKLLSEEYYPLVLIDRRMPDMDALDLCRKIRSLPNGARMVTIMITGSGSPEELTELLEAGADDYITEESMNSGLHNIRLRIARERAEKRSRQKEIELVRKEISSELEGRHEDMRQIFNKINLGVFITDRYGAIEFLNHSAAKLAGSGYRNIKGKHWDNFFPLTQDEKEQIEMMRRSGPEKQGALSFKIKGREWKESHVDIDVRDDLHNPERLIFLLYDVSEVHNLRAQLRGASQFHEMIGRSEPMRRLRKQIEDYAAVDLTVLIEGETGSGKELIARAIHYSSGRKDKPFITINSAGLSDSLLSSQLFGHKRGAFTGAVDDHIGVFESAHGGTLFLDEIGDISPYMQVSLMRVLEERTIVRLGERKERKIDVRFVTATNKDLNTAVAQGAFRDDLLYRIRVARISAPPLRQRREDIPMLAEHFLAKSREASGKTATGISPGAMSRIIEYNWPGNVRELKSAIDYAAVHCQGGFLMVEDLPVEISVSNPSVKPAVKPAEVTLDTIHDAIQTAEGNHAKAARLLGISRATLYRRLGRQSSS